MSVYFIQEENNGLIKIGYSDNPNQRLRGRSSIGLRYTLILLDDFESELNTKTVERRKEIKEWVMSTVDPALENEAGKEGAVWLIGTIVHFDSFLSLQ